MAVIRDPSELNEAHPTPSGRALECEDLGSGPRVPQLDGPIPAGGQQARAVRAEFRRLDRSVCPLRVRTSAPVTASHTFAVPSSLAVTIRDPSGLNDVD